MTARRIELGLDCNDKELLKPFWAEALGYVGSPDDDDELRDPAGAGPVLWFQVVPEGKTAKNRLHLDIWLPAAEEPALRQRLVELGGSVLREEKHYTVLADPEGNELCLCWNPPDGGIRD